jgi:glycosyltransferase involved in cell wall biosynthesis
MKIAFVYKIKYAVSPYHINILKFFSRNYDLTILTNDVSFLKERGIEAKYIDIPNFALPSLSYWFINDCIINLKLRVLDYDLLVIWYDSLLFFKSKKPVFRFVDICPYQSIGYSKKGDKIRLDRKIFLKMLVYSFKKSSFNVTVSPQLKQWLVDYGVPEDKIKWLPHGVDLERFSSDNLSKKPEEEYILINTGAFLSIRGSDMIIKSMKMLSNFDENIRHLSLGNRDEGIKKWNSIFRKVGIENNIKLYGMIDNKEIPEFLSKAKIGISILEKNEYYSRSPPQKIFEYMAMGLPIIANDIPTHTEFIKDGYNGFIIDSAEEMVEAILKLKNDDELYEKISTNARESAKKYGFDKIELKLKEYVANLVTK